MRHTILVSVRTKSTLGERQMRFSSIRYKPGQPSQPGQPSHPTRHWLIVSSKFEDSQSPDETHESGVFPFKNIWGGASNDILDQPGQPSQPGQLIH